MNLEKIVSDEPLYEGISRFSEFQAKPEVQLNWKHALFISFASSFCGASVWYTLDSGKDKFNIEWYESAAIACGVALVLGLSALIFHHVRCTVSLMLPVLCSGVGRSILRTLIVTLVLSGPLQNIINNSLILANSLSCSASLTVEQAEHTANTARDIMRSQMESMQQTVHSINTQSRLIEEFANAEMVKALQDEDEEGGHLSPGTMLKKSADRCHSNTDGPRRKCEAGLNSDLDKCEQIEINRDGCQQYDKGEGNNDVNRQKTKEIEDAVSGIGEQLTEPDMNITSSFNVEINTENLIQGFNVTLTKLDRVVTAVSYFTNLLSLVLLCMVTVDAVKHQVKYLTKLSYLNDVVTTSLLELDESLPSYHRTFPLPNYMQRFVRDGKKKFFTGEEFKLVCIATMKHLLFSMLFLVLVFLDVQIYGVLEDIADTGYIIYEVYLKIGVLLESDGGKWTKSIMDQIPHVNDIHHMSFTQDNNNCLPDAIPPDQQTTICILVFLGIIILLNVLEVYSKRSIRRLCAWFYPDRETKRVLFLYRSLKQRRIDCFNNIVEDRRGNLPTRRWFTRLYHTIFKLKCVTCQSKKQHYVCLMCYKNGFDIMYCWDCWFDANNNCLFCDTTHRLAHPSQSPDSSSESSETGSNHTVNSDDELDNVLYASHSYSKYPAIAEIFAESSGDESGDALLPKKKNSRVLSMFSANLPSMTNFRPDTVAARPHPAPRPPRTRRAAPTPAPSPSHLAPPSRAAPSPPPAPASPPPAPSPSHLAVPSRRR